jgi:hypothetical protein
MEKRNVKGEEEAKMEDKGRRLATDPEVPGAIPGSTRFSEK